MPSEDSGRSRAQTRSRTRVVLVVCCLLAVGLAGVLVPSLTGGVVDSPAESLVPGDAIQSEAAKNLGELSSAGLGDIDAGRLGQRSGFGALNPGQSTDIGGSTGASAALDSQSTAEHFVVRSSSPAYWRTGSYDRYTGTGWEQTGETTAFDGSSPGSGIQGPRVDYRVELNRSATALPTVWRPDSIDGVSDLELTDGHAVRAGSSLDPGTAFIGTSYRPPQDPQVVRNTGRNYPATIEERYTALPDDTPSRVRLFTDDITSDASSPYETAVAIESWLEANKEYSLEASRTSDHMTDAFLFEMDTGYCEYFATAMTTMLRSQDIPARYVVGYSTGQEVAEDTYKVRGMNAHAWVEVYFEDAGWVKFDPTPGTARLQQEQQSVQEDDPNADYAPTEQGSPGEEFSPTENGTSPGGDGDGEDPGGDPINETTPTGETESGYQVALNRTAVPGVPVTVTVTQNGELQSGVAVLFNDDPMGRTDADGTVIGTVPYTEELRIGVRNDSTGALAAPGGLPDGTDGRFYSVGTVSDRLDPPNPGNLTVPVNTNTTVAVTGETVPNANVTVTATVGDIPLRNATVSVAGEDVAMTNRAGQATVTLPDAGSNVTITVQRGSISGTRNVTLPTLSVDVRPTTPVALPYTAVAVNVTASGEPVGNAPVYLDGEQVATTDINGTATVTLPLAGQATIEATGAGVTKEVTVAGLYTNLGLVALALALVVGGVFGLAYRRGYGPRDVLWVVLNLPALAVRYSQWLLVTIATRWDDILSLLVARVRLTGVYLRDAVRGKLSLAELRAAFRAWLAAKRARLAPEEGTPAAENGASRQHRTIRRAWRQFLGYLSLRRTRTKTPGEIAQHAVHRDGLPSKPVRVLRDTYREVEYGARSADDRIERVDAAVTAIEAEIQTDTDGEDEPDTAPTATGGTD